MSEEQDILQELGIEEINEDTQNYYSIMVYGKSGTGKTTLATRENNVFYYRYSRRWYSSNATRFCEESRQLHCF